MTTKRYRPAGKGSVRNRGTKRNPRWEAIFFTRVDGKRKQISKGGFATKSDAEDWLTDQLERERNGKLVLPIPLTVGEHLQRWLDVAGHGLSASTLLSYQSIIDGRLVPHIGDIRLQELRPDHIAKMLDSLRQPGANRRGHSTQGLSETSLVRTHQVLRTSLAAAVRGNQIASNPADGIVKPRVARSIEMSVWTGQELATFLASAATDRLHPILHLATHTGMRRGELLGLRWSHVDLESQFITVMASRNKVGTEMLDGPTKTTAGTRRIDLDAGTVATLRKWRAQQYRDQLAWGAAHTSTEFVFTREDGTPLHADHLAGRFKKLVKAAGVPVIRFHDLRHTHATLMLLAGAPVKVVSERLGHASPGFTMATYQHVLPGQQAEAAASFASLIAGSS